MLTERGISLMEVIIVLFIMALPVSLLIFHGKATESGVI